MLKDTVTPRRKLVVANWKMYGDLDKNEQLLKKLVAELKSAEAVDFAVCVPFPYLFQAHIFLRNSNIAWGAQNVSQHQEGAFTGSISAQMIRDFYCRYAIIGHSERRALSSESDVSATNRFMQTIKVGITPIFCVGETEEERKQGLAKSVVEKQVCAVIDQLSDADFALMVRLNTVFTYEPVWAIGTGNNATPEEAEAMHQFIRQLIAKRDAHFAQRVRLLYGGSIRPNNAEALFSQPNIDGGLVGRSSLDAQSFIAICHAASENQLKEAV